MYNSLLNLHYTNRRKTIAFADDLILITRGKTVREAENIANIEMTKTSAWAKANKILFNKQKSKVMLLTRKCKERNKLEIYLHNRPLMHVLSLKYLGIISDSKLPFREHVNYITDKCSKLIFALAKPAKLSWGLSSAPLKIIYTGAILPLLLYGAPISINAIKNMSYKHKLTRVQRLINIRIAKAYHTVSNEAFCMITGLTPIDIKLEEATLSYQFTNGSTKGETGIDHDTRT